MSRPPRARESVLDAFEAILIDDGERRRRWMPRPAPRGSRRAACSTTSASKDALEAGLVERLGALARRGHRAMIVGARGRPSPYFLRPRSWTTTRSTARSSRRRASPRAATRAAGAALREIRERWEDAMRPHTRGSGALDLVMLVSDGLYFNNALEGGGIPREVPTSSRRWSAHRARRGRSCDRAPGAREGGRRAPPRDVRSGLGDLDLAEQVGLRPPARISSRIAVGHGRVDGEHRRARGRSRRGARPGGPRC